MEVFGGSGSAACNIEHPPSDQNSCSNSCFEDADRAARSLKYSVVLFSLSNVCLFAFSFTDLHNLEKLI